MQRVQQDVRALSGLDLDDESYDDKFLADDIHALENRGYMQPISFHVSVVATEKQHVSYTV